MENRFQKLPFKFQLAALHRGASYPRAPAAAAAEPRGDERQPRPAGARHR
jgi:hypothetical protein